MGQKVADTFIRLDYCAPFRLLFPSVSSNFLFFVVVPRLVSLLIFLCFSRPIDLLCDGRFFVFALDTDKHPIKIFFCELLSEQWRLTNRASLAGEKSVPGRYRIICHDKSVAFHAWMIVPLCFDVPIN